VAVPAVGTVGVAAVNGNCRPQAVNAADRRTWASATTSASPACVPATGASLAWSRG